MKDAMVKMIRRMAPNPGQVYERINGCENSVSGCVRIKLAWTDDAAWKPGFVERQTRWVNMSAVDDLIPMRDALGSFEADVWDASAPSAGMGKVSVLSDGRMLVAGGQDCVICRERFVYDVPGLYVLVPEMMLSLMRDAGENGRLACSDGAVAYADGKHRVYVGLEFERMNGTAGWMRSALEWMGYMDKGLEPVQMNWQGLVDELEKGEDKSLPDPRMWRYGGRWLSACRYAGLDEKRRAGWDPRPISDKWARLALRISGLEISGLEMREVSKWDKSPWCKWISGDGATRVYARCAPRSE